MKSTISKTFSLEASHRLPQHQGKCRNLHGHSYKVTVVLHGSINNQDGSSHGMVLDFEDLSQAFDEWVFKALDHQDLNLVIEYPTAENIAIWIFDKLQRHLPESLDAVEVSETDNTSATISREDFYQTNEIPDLIEEERVGNIVS